MQRQSPPKHRHDGTSPLPLGMDWSPPPKRWAGQETIWPHDPRTGWSYCVTIPSWVLLAKSRDSDPVVFYRILVGLQSPDGITTTRVVLRRFNDFLKFHAALKRIFPKKNLPSAPPKGFSRLKSKTLLEERRSALEEWMTKLLSDIDISRSVASASFLELEAAARSSFQDDQQLTSETRPPSNETVSSPDVHPSAGLSALAGSSSVASDYGSDTAYEASDIDSTSLGRGNPSELGTEDLSMDEDLSSPIDKFMKYGMSNIDEGLFMGQAILDQLGNFPRHKIHTKEINNVMEESMSNGNASKSPYTSGDITEHFSEQDHCQITHHARKLSAESVGSDITFQRGTELSNSALPNGDGYAGTSKASKASGNTEILDKDLTIPDNIQLVLPSDQRHKMHRVITTMQRRLGTAKTDMEDLISRLNQEIAVKDYLSTKVKDLEVELEATKEKSKENLEQAILIERERVTQMQWDMEDLRRKSMEMEHKLNSQQGEINKDSTVISLRQEKDALQKELTDTKQQFEELLKRHQELEVKSKADIKVLIKEVKTLRSSQSELKQKLNESFKEKTEIESQHAQERQISEQLRTSWRKLLHDCEVLQQRFEECTINLADEDENNMITKFQLLPDALHLLSTSDDQISLLLAEAQHLEQGANSLANEDAKNNVDIDTKEIMEKTSKILKDVFVSNGKLRKQVNSVLRHALEPKTSFNSVTEGPQGENVQNDELDE